MNNMNVSKKQLDALKTLPTFLGIRLDEFLIELDFDAFIDLAYRGYVKGSPSLPIFVTITDKGLRQVWERQRLKAIVNDTVYYYTERQEKHDGWYNYEIYLTPTAPLTVEVHSSLKKLNKFELAKLLKTSGRFQ